MTLQSRFLFHSAPRSVWWLVLIAALWTQTCRADLIVGNADPMNHTVSEKIPFGLGSVTFTVINTELRDVKIDKFVLRASPRFGPAI
jgi:hypothetical protein